MLRGSKNSENSWEQSCQLRYTKTRGYTRAIPYSQHLYCFFSRAGSDVRCHPHSNFLTGSVDLTILCSFPKERSAFRMVALVRGRTLSCMMNVQPPLKLKLSHKFQSIFGGRRSKIELG